MSPDEVRKLNREGKPIGVYSPSLGITIKQSRLVTGGNVLGSHDIEYATEGKMVEYQNRMRGSQWDDLRLAGLDVDDNKQFFGIGFRRITLFGNHYIHATRGSKAAWASTRRSYTSILSQDHKIPLPVMTSDEEWRTVTEYGKTSETKVKDEQKYTFYWFDRA